MKLFVNDTSPYARVVRLVAQAAGLDPEIVVVDPWSLPDALLAVNPAGRVSMPIEISPESPGQNSPLFRFR